ncbi:ribbon-helix-helix domain-containing protein [Sulfodiicoccus acidiphilus]|nr:ribbon-helix-helix domain-containing protein [Sulfodiicoccus acidiphilus]
MERPKFSSETNDRGGDKQKDGTNNTVSTSGGRKGREVSKREIVIDNDGTTTVSFKFDKSYIEYLEQVKERLHFTNMSEFLRNAIEEYLEFLKNDKSEDSAK